MADLKLTIDNSTDAERAAVDAVLTADDHAVVKVTERLVYGGMARRNARRHLLLPGLHALQAEIGWISPGGLNYLCDVLQVPPAEAYGVATFYELFRVDDPGHADSVHHVCMDTSCHIAGAEEFAQTLEAEGKQVHRGPCLGQCERAPAQFVQGRGEPDHVPADEPGADSHGDVVAGRLLARVGVVDPTSLASYREHGGYVALQRSVELGAADVIDEIRRAGLTGRGGAAFPTAIKWQGVAGEHGRPKHVIANADESEPGTFKDRIVMENDPFSVIEGLTLAGLAVGAENGWIYIRGEYPLATERLQSAIDQATAAGFLGDRIARSNVTFDIELRRGAGAYICGEETALFNSIEGFRGEPRQKPPFPTTNGLFDRPTVVNNPETLLNVLEIVTDGGDAYAASGTPDTADQPGSNGQKLFCASGHVATPGLYEVEFGPTLGQILDLAGGVNGTLRAVLLGGAAGAFVGPDDLDMPLTFEGVASRGQSLGSGVVMAFNDTTDFPAVVTRIADFFRNESCGQCVPCRVGAVRQHELLTQTGGRVSPPQLTLLNDMDRAMKDASICGLGHTASTAVLSAIALGLMEEAT